MKEKIFFLHTFGLGDYLMLLPSLNNAINKYDKGNVYIAILEEPVYRFVKMSKLFNEDNIIKVGYTFSSILRIRNFLLENKIKTSIHSAGMNPIKFLIFSKIVNFFGSVINEPILEYINGSLSSVHRVDRNLHLLSKFSNNKEQLKLPTIITDKINLDGINIGIHIGSKRAYSFKRLSVVQWMGLLKKLDANGYNIYIYSGADEVSESRELRDGLLSCDIRVNYFEHIEFKLLLKYINSMDLFISSDSGLGHFAMAMNVRSLSIFGPTNEKEVGPYGNNSFVFRDPNFHENCTPCFNGKRVMCPLSDIKCLKYIDINDLHISVEGILKYGVNG